MAPAAEDAVKRRIDHLTRQLGLDATQQQKVRALLGEQPAHGQPRNIDRQDACAIKVLPKRRLHHRARCDAASGAVRGEAPGERGFHVRVDAYAFVPRSCAHGYLLLLLAAYAAAEVLRHGRAHEHAKKSDRLAHGLPTF